MVLMTKSKEQAILAYAKKLQPDMELDEIIAYINRPVQWNIIFSYARDPRVKRITCEICSQEGSTRIWCTPCIHGNWCCECCIALGIPNYSTGFYILGSYKCSVCGTEFSDFRGFQKTRAGLGEQATVKPKVLKCPKCETVDMPSLPKADIDFSEELSLYRDKQKEGVDISRGNVNGG